MKGHIEYDRKWSKEDISNINCVLIGFNKHKPKEIHRAVRGLKDIHFWKGTEFRSFLLYYGIVALKKFLPEDVYRHFLMLNCAARICYTDAYKIYLHIAKDWFNQYVEEYINIYGSGSIGSNLHNLNHVCDEVERYGCLMSISTYPFENKLQFLKSKVKQPNLVLQQITRRLVELSLDYEQLYTAVNSSKNSNFPQLQFAYKLDNTSVYKALQIDSECTISSVKKSNSWFLTTCREIVSMKYALAHENEILIYGTPIIKKDNFFTYPVSSKYLDIYKSDGETGPVKVYNLQTIKSKMIYLPDESDFVFMPLLHTLKY